METSGELVRLLMRLGYWSTWHGLYAEAAALFNGAKAARPESELPVLGMSVLAMVMNKPEHAVQLIEQMATPLRPESELVKAHLGCALRLAGREDEGVAILKNVAARSSDKDASTMALNLLDLSAEQLKPHLAKVL